MSHKAPVAVLTGGAGGLGAAFCTVLLEKGYRVCMSDMPDEKSRGFVETQRKKYGTDNVKLVECDITKEDDFDRLFKAAWDMNFDLQRKRIDLVLNNAGIILEQNLQKVIEANFVGPIIGCRLALQYMGKSNGKKGGMIINTASITGVRTSQTVPVSAGSKHGVIGLTRTYGTPENFKKDNVLFSAICLSVADTEMLRRYCRTNPSAQGLDPGSEHKVITPEYVAQGISKLLEDKINGASLLVTKSGYSYIN